MALAVKEPSDLEEALIMAKNGNRTKRTDGRSIFRELISGIQAMREHREGLLMLRTTKVAPITSPLAQVRSGKKAVSFLKRG